MIKAELAHAKAMLHMIPAELARVKAFENSKKSLESKLAEEIKHGHTDFWFMTDPTFAEILAQELRDNGYKVYIANLDGWSYAHLHITF